MAKKSVKLKFKHKKLIKFLLLITFVYICFHLSTTYLFKYNPIGIKFKNNSILTYIKKITNKQKQLSEKYDSCIANGLVEENFSEDTKNKKNEILSYTSKNNLRYKYENLKYNYQITYKENDSLYGASLIKVVAALYLIDKDEDLSKTIKYESKYDEAYSEGMKNHKHGENIKILDLLKYSITYSDNTAYKMLYTYIGRNTLKEYATSLGAKAIFTGSSDNFGNQTAYDTAVYLKRAYELSIEKENGKILKDAMLNTRRNKLNIPDKVTIAHKYGEYNEYFHNIGINYSDHPYTISILSNKGESKASPQMNNLSLLTYEFNELYYDNLESYCHNLVYEKD